MGDPFRRSVVAAGSSSAAQSPTGIPSNAARSPVDFTAARADVTDATAGRVTLAMLDLVLLGLIGFYLVTKTVQGAN